MATNILRINGQSASDYLNNNVECEDLAIKLGMKQIGGKKGNWRSPRREDKNPSVTMYPPKGTKGSTWWDHTIGKGGGPIDLVMYANGNEDFVQAVKELCDMFGYVLDKPKADPAAPPQKQTLVDFIAEQCLNNVKTDSGRVEVIDYLESRGITRKVIEHALMRKTLGFNTYTSKTVAKGEVGYGGPGVAFIVRQQLSGAVVALELRYLDPELNGGKKSGSQGEKRDFPWCSDWRRLKEATTVYVVESCINALTIETCFLPGSVAIATRGTGNVENIDWSFLRGKQVIACFDNDLPIADGRANSGYCTGSLAAWRLHEILTGLDISCVLVDQSDWFEDPERTKPINDINDWLKNPALGKDRTEATLKKLEGWMIPGMVGDDKRRGKPRIWLPQHDYHAYWKYRTQLDFTRSISKITKSEEAEAPDKLEFSDVAGFRIAAISRVRIASPTSTMTGDDDHSPTTVFALSVQTARHGATLQRRVVDDEKLHNLDVWKKLGPVYAPSAFSRMVNIWERAASIGAREAINYVGVAWRDGRTVVNEGPDCFFADPRQQCPYSGLTFPSGQIGDARQVIELFQNTFKGNAAAIILVWALGAHLKAFLGFWPHFVMQAEKGTGKTTLTKRVERAVAMTMFSRQTLGSEFRQLTSISYTSHPVGWEEISAGKQDTINKAVANLQESYMYSHTRRGAELMDFLLCAPVLLAGEDVPVKSLQGKVVRTELTKAGRGALIPENMPVFPVRQWLQFVAASDKATVTQAHSEIVERLQANCLAKREDAGAERMVVNYAALGLAWQMLCEFADIPVDQGRFMGDLTTVMNKHISESESDRQPWAWIVEKLLSEIATHSYKFPYRFDTEQGIEVLCVRPGFVMDHISQAPNLREFWDGLPVKTAQVFKRQLLAAGVLVMDDKDPTKPADVERTVRGSRIAHMVCLDLDKLKQFGLHAVVPADPGATGKPLFPKRADGHEPPFDYGVDD
ncbi:MAG: toprim domain-containing protein [Pseudomonadota bacterium]